MQRPHLFTKTLLAGVFLYASSLAISATAHAAAISGPCANFYSAGFSLTEGERTVAAPAGPKPAKGVVLTDPVAKACLVRATDHTADGLTGFAVNDYSRRQPFNVDDTKMMIESGNGFWYLYDANTLKNLGVLEGLSGDPEAQWSPTDPNTIYYTQNDGGLQIKALNITTNTSTVVADFTGKIPWPNAVHCWSHSYGSPSKDGRYWGFKCEDANFNVLGMMVWDLPNNKLVGSLSMTGGPRGTSMSPSGRWVIYDGLDGMYAYSPDFTVKKKLYTTTEHSDIAIGANGDDILVSIDYSGNGAVFMIDIDTGVRTDLFQSYINGSASAMHISGKAFNTPGWVLVSAYNSTPSRDGTMQWFQERVFALQLAPNPKVYQIASHNSAPYNGYWTEPHAVTNRNFTRLLFNSNWLTGSATDIDAYMVQLPEGVVTGGATTPPPTNTPPTANFTASANGLTANFADTSTDAGGSIVTRAWNFGDGSTSNVASPSHTYASAGTYSVSLTVTDNGGLSATSTQTVNVSTSTAPNSKPVSSFTFASSGLTANFTDASSDSDGSIVQRVWKFGDSTTSIATNPSHTYAAAGTYNVALTVTDNKGLSAVSYQAVQITSTQPANQKPVASFTSSQNGLSASFTDTSVDGGGSIIGRAWNFGDGGTSNAANPSHTYTAAGNFYVTLMVIDNSGLRAVTSQPISVAAGNGKPPIVAEGGPCGTFYSAGFTLTPGQLAVSPPAFPKPAKGAVLGDPSFRDCLVRVTDHAADGIPSYAISDNSRRQPFNADGSRFLVTGGNEAWYLYDANTLQNLKQLNGPSGSAEPQWHPTNPNVLYYLPSDGGTKLYALDVSTNTTTTAADFAGKLPWNNAAHVWTHGEGSPSRDGRYWAFQVEDANFNTLGLVVWDLVNNKVVGSTATSTRPDYVSMSPSGRWLVSSSGAGVFAWSPDFSSKKQLATQNQNADLAIAANGDDAFVSIDYASGNVFMVDIDSGARTDLLQTYINGSTTSVNVSGKGYGLPGWALVSTYAGQPSRGGSAPWFEERVFALQLAANPQVYEIAAHRSSYNGGLSMPLAAPNQDFTRILFNSNWLGNNTADMDTYMVQLPAGAVPASH